jgi:GNAT superfamily N-acetyltransferase
MTQQIIEADETRIAEIELWLDAEEATYETAMSRWEEEYEGDPPIKGFRCNWDSVKKGWREGGSKVSILVVDDETVGFLVDRDILEIRPDRRGSGYGRVLAEHMLEHAREEGRSVVKIGIAPSSAKPFWRRMGFTVLDHRRSSGGTFAYRIFSRTFDLGDGDRISYAVSFLTERERYSDEPRPFTRFTGLGELHSDGRIQLPERAICFNPEDDQHVDYFVKIEVAGVVVHFDKAKYPESTAFGVMQDAGGDFFIDMIDPVQV